jgi:serine/threonine-protein kinase
VTADPDDLTGQTLLGRYHLQRILGRGGMGYVYLAEQVTIHKQVAVKVLSTTYASNPEHKERFLREAKAASKVAHDNVIEVIDFGATPNGSVFIAMELLHGEELSELVAREAPLSWVRAKKIILQVCRAIHAAHEQDILHRDIKPENCFRIKRGANRDFIKVLDFGLAKAVGREAPQQAITQTGAVFGTAEYMSPEQARAKSVDARSDVYAVGVMLYELMTGRVPFEAESFMEVLAAQISDPPRPPREVAPQAEISPELEALILKALAKDPDERFGSMRRLAEAVAAVPVASSVPAAVPATRTPLEKTLLLAVCALALISVIQLVVLIIVLTR